MSPLRQRQPKIPRLQPLQPCLPLSTVLCRPRQRHLQTRQHQGRKAQPWQVAAQSCWLQDPQKLKPCCQDQWEAPPPEWERQRPRSCRPSVRPSSQIVWQRSDIDALRAYHQMSRASVKCEVQFSSVISRPRPALTPPPALRQAPPPPGLTQVPSTVAFGGYSIIASVKLSPGLDNSTGNSTATRQLLDRIALDSSTKLDSYSTETPLTPCAWASRCQARQLDSTARLDSSTQPQGSACQPGLKCQVTEVGSF